LPSGLLLLSCALVVAGFLGCTSDASSPDAPADTTSTVSAPTAPDSSASAPTKALASVERGEDPRSVAQKLEDTSTETRVKRALVQTPSLRVFSFRPAVVNGHLVLRGDVNTADQYRQAQQIARQVDGVSALTNQVTMGGRPVTDERLNSTAEADEAADTDEAAVYHTVQQGDTLWDIAREHRASVRQIQRLNDLGPSSLRPGQRIRVR
jgi:nucleoid-associated protein YgaU